MRARAILFAVVVLAGAVFGGWKLAQRAVGWYEQAVAAQSGTALAAAGQSWASVTVDGLKVTLNGEAPDESSRFSAVEVARQVVDPARLADATTVKASPPLPPAPFALELLRNDAEISLIGLVPETGGRDVIRSALGAGGLSERVTDLLETSRDPPPDGWSEALGFGLSVVAELPRAKISVAPGRVGVVAVADSDTAREALEARLRHAAPGKVALDLDISAPRPVISPFSFGFAVRGGQGVLETCSADTPESAARILAAVRAAGLAGPADCRIGLGAPSAGWTAAVVRGLEALRQLGGGEFTLQDMAAQLTGPAGTPPEKLAEVSAALDTALPDVFALKSVMPPVAKDADAAPPVHFTAALAADGTVRLSGAVLNDTSRQAIDSYARSLFGHDRVSDATATDTALPDGWPVRVLAGIEALSMLKEGTLDVTTDEVTLDGWGIERGLDTEIAAELAEKLGPGAATVKVAYNADAAAAALEAMRPRPEICADQIGAILDADSIQFAPGSADIDPGSRGVIAAIADVLRGCPGADFEIGGHTDDKGPAEANRSLSEARAQAVLAALRAQDLPLVRLAARGFGADDPVADNASESGRAQNRRIEFTLIDPGGAGEGEPGAAATAAADEEMPAATASGESDAPDETGAEACAADAEEVLAGKQVDFAPGASTIGPEGLKVVASVAEALKSCPEAALEIGAYTDAQGSESGNLRLSQERADAVLAALQAEGGPLPALTAHGYGEADPVADNATEEGRRQNRRIAVTVIPDEGDGSGADSAGVAEGDIDEAAADSACGAGIAAAEAKGRIEFTVGTATLTPESSPVIEAIEAALRQCPDVTMEIGGYTDSVGSESGNLRLSQQRADAVLAALRSADLPLPGVTARGYGESNPVADNSTFEGRARNRRIAFNLAGETGTGEGDGSE